MTAQKKIGIAVIAVAGAMFATATLADKGAFGMGGPGAGPKLDEMFATADADKDGKLTYAELEAQRKAEFTAADTNADGSLSAEELSARELARFQEKLAERVQKMLDDRDNDGSTSLSEDEIGDGPVMQNFARLDTDNDGAITKAEVQEGAKKHRKHRRGEGPGEGPAEAPAEN